MKSLVSQPKKALILLLLLPLLGFKKTQRLSAQETLNTYNTSWTSVLPGSVLSEPAVTSLGCTSALLPMQETSWAILQTASYYGKRTLAEYVTSALLPSKAILFYFTTKQKTYSGFLIPAEKKSGPSLLILSCFQGPLQAAMDVFLFTAKVSCSATE